MLSQGSEPIRAPASFSMVSNGLRGDKNDLLGMNLFHLSGKKLDNEFLGSSLHGGAFHLEIDGLSRRHCPRKFKDTQSAKGTIDRKSQCVRNQAGIWFQCSSCAVPVLHSQ